MFHCHNLVHEDHVMMRSYNVTKTERGRVPQNANNFGNLAVINNIVAELNGETVMVYDRQVCSMI